MNVAVKPSDEAETAPVSVMAPSEILKLDNVTVQGSIGLLNRTCTTVFIGTPFSERLGLTLATEGTVVSVTALVVNDNVPGFARASPPTSMICELVTTV